ncbi:hypothetical protein [Streptomyces sp. NPDC021356]|uniref:hypothetical protein n=1 Tax=Streptomyces sp. NPDC021356 TaxID=3154900 RepID=UPI0033CAF4EB
MDNTHGGPALLMAVLVVAVVIRRQLRTRRVLRNGSLVVPRVFGILGALAIAIGAGTQNTLARARAATLGAAPAPAPAPGT